jgi:phage repressor protein C with HTH and peptisase S24 domain
MAGTSQPQIRRLELGERKFTREWAERLAPFLDRSAQELLFGQAAEGEQELRPVPGDLIPVRVAGTVEAGAFREADEFVQSEDVTVFEPRDAQFPNARIFALDVAGDSMNDLKPRPILPGDRIICVDFDDLEDRVPLRDGMIVVVEQVRDGGHLREWSVKQVQYAETETRFLPRSTNPRHKPIVVKRDLKADDGRSVKVLALVRGVRSEFAI